MRKFSVQKRKSHAETVWLLQGTRLEELLSGYSRKINVENGLSVPMCAVNGC